MVPRGFAKGVGIAFVAMLVLGSVAAVAGGRDKTPPTAPTNLAVTGKTSFTVSLAWGSSTDNSGTFSYVIQASNGRSAPLPQTSTSFTFTNGLESSQSYSFYAYAVDGAGLKSKAGNTVITTLPRDTIAPTKPIVSVTEVGATHVSLSWSSTDDGPFVSFTVFMDGTAVLWPGRSTSGWITLLEPETTHAFTVQARDNGINWSPVSDPVTATTSAVNADDANAPTTPANLRTNGMVFGAEVWLFWDESTDDLDSQDFIRYDVYDNGALVDRIVGAGQTVFYGTEGIMNTTSVIAVDSAGNASSPATIVLEL